MATSSFRTAAVRQVLRRIYPHQAMGYARRHLRDRVLGSLTIADAVGLLETFAYSLVPREAQGLVQYFQGLNTELCQAGPVEKSQPVRQLPAPSRLRQNQSAKLNSTQA